MENTKKKYHHGDLKNALITQGIIMINEGGIDKFSFNQLAKKCAVTPHAIYSRFSSKEDLLVAIHDKVIEEFGKYLSITATKTSAFRPVIKARKLSVTLEYFDFLENLSTFNTQIF